MKKLLVGIVVAIVLASLIGCASQSVISSEDFEEVSKRYEEASKSLADVSEQLESAKTVIADKDIELIKADGELKKLQSEYDEYKEIMSAYEGLEAAEAEARQIEAERLAAEAEAESRAIAESEAAAAAEEAARLAAEQEEKERMGYETGITYEQLARTPDAYKGEKVKFYGKVLQVMEGSDEIQIRLAVDGDYDRVLYIGYDPAIVSWRILEDDYITIYGTSIGLFSYQSTMSGTITIPAVYVDRIDQ